MDTRATGSSGARKRANPDEAGPRCSICLEATPKRRRLAHQEGCSHRYHRECFARHVEVCVFDGRLNITCPECPRPVLREELVALLPAPVVQRYDYLRRREAMVNSSARPCRTPDCEGTLRETTAYRFCAMACRLERRMEIFASAVLCALVGGFSSAWAFTSLDNAHPAWAACSCALGALAGVSISQPAQRSRPRQLPSWARRASCDTCQSVACIACGEAWHEAPCAGDAEDMLKSWADVRDARRCPKCSSMIERVSGCNHMTCRCGHEFCWLCSKAYTSTHFTRGPCTQYGDPRGRLHLSLFRGWRGCANALALAALVVELLVATPVGVPTIFNSVALSISAIHMFDVYWPEHALSVPVPVMVLCVCHCVAAHAEWMAVFVAVWNYLRSFRHAALKYHVITLVAVHILAGIGEIVSTIETLVGSEGGVMPQAMLGNVLLGVVVLIVVAVALNLFTAMLGGAGPYTEVEHLALGVVLPLLLSLLGLATASEGFLKGCHGAVANTLGVYLAIMALCVHLALEDALRAAEWEASLILVWIFAWIARLIVEVLHVGTGELPSWAVEGLVILVHLVGVRLTEVVSGGGARAVVGFACCVGLAKISGEDFQHMRRAERVLLGGWCGAVVATWALAACGVAARRLCGRA